MCYFSCFLVEIGYNTFPPSYPPQRGEEDIRHGRYPTVPRNSTWVFLISDLWIWWLRQRSVGLLAGFEVHLRASLHLISRRKVIEALAGNTRCGHRVNKVVVEYCLLKVSLSPAQKKCWLRARGVSFSLYQNKPRCRSAVVRFYDPKYSQTQDIIFTLVCQSVTLTYCARHENINRLNFLGFRMLSIG